MKVISKNISDLKPYEKNQRVHSDEQIEKIAESIKTFGFNVPILITKDNVIIAGHGRFYASSKLGLSEVPCVVAENLTDAQIKAYRIADNKLGDLSYFDNDLLVAELKELKLDYDFDIELTGFDEMFLKAFDFANEEEEEQEEEEEEPAAPAERGTTISMSFAVTSLQRDTITQALNKIKSQEEFETQVEALVYMCESWV